MTTGRASWIRRSLLVAQVALCMALLAAAVLFLRTFIGLSTSDLGFDPSNMLTARASLQDPTYRSRDAVAALYRATLTDITRLPGVEAAAVTNNLPVERGLNLAMRQVPENVLVPGAIDWRYVAGDYLRVLRIPLVAGRAFGEADHGAGGPFVALVNEAFARRFGGGRTVTGTRLQMTAIEVDDEEREIVGIVGDVRTRGVTATQPTVFVPVEQVPDHLLGAVHDFFQVHWALRTREGGTGLIPSVERVIREADPLLSVTAFRTMDEVVAGALAPARFSALLLSLFAAAALALAAAGLYSIVAYTVAQRKKEIGIRLALGATGGQVTMRFAQDGIALAAVGAVVGLGAAVLFLAVLRSVTPDADLSTPFDGRQREQQSDRLPRQAAAQRRRGSTVVEDAMRAQSSVMSPEPVRRVTGAPPPRTSPWSRPRRTWRTATGCSRRTAPERARASISNAASSGTSIWMRPDPVARSHAAPGVPST